MAWRGSSKCPSVPLLVWGEADHEEWLIKIEMWLIWYPIVGSYWAKLLCKKLF
jgi:hypothetical protein